MRLLLLAFVADRRAQALEQLLFLVHQLVGAAEHVVRAGIVARQVVRYAHRYHRAAVCDMVHRAVVQHLRQVAAHQVVAPGDHRREFVAAHAVYRAVREDLAHHFAGVADIIVARLVALGVVDLFQAVHVAHGDGEGLGGVLADALVQLFLGQQVGVLVFDPRHGIDHGQALVLLRALVHVGVVGQDDHQREAEHAHGDQDGARVVLALAGQLRLHEALVVQPLFVGLRPLVIPVDGRLHALVGGDHALAHPDQRGEQQQRQDAQPHDDRRAEAPFAVAVQDIAEEHEAQHAPYHEQQVGFLGQRALGDQVGQQDAGAKDRHRAQARAGDARLAPVVRLFRRAHGAGRHQSVDQRGADGGHVHDPFDGRAAQQRDQHRHAHRQQHGLRGRTVRVHAGEALGQHALARQGVKQAAQRRDVADQAGHHQGEQRQRQRPHAEPAQVMIGGVEGGQGLEPVQAVQVADIGRPALILRRISRDGQQRDQDVQRQRADHGDQQQPADAPAVEIEFLRAVGHALEPDERPGRHEGDADGLRYRRSVGQEGRALRRAARRGCADQAHGDARREQAGQDDHQRLRRAPAPRAEQPRQRQRGGG